MSTAKRRPPIVGRYTREELALAARNSGMPLEALRHDITPGGLHYLLIHFDIPQIDAARWRLEVGGRVARPLRFTLEDLRALPARTVRITMECAGNGRGQMVPRYASMPWLKEGVSTADWTGVPLERVLSAAGVQPEAKDIAFHGADHGIDRGVEHPFARSLAPAEALREDVLLAYEMNGAPLPPQHGFPLRLVAPGWYGMASVKWLTRIEALARPFDGLQQAVGYHFKTEAGAKGTPCTRIRVNSLMAPPGIPDFYTRLRVVSPGRIAISGRAWSGEGRVVRVQFAVDGEWSEARAEPREHEFGWQAWSATWDAAQGEHELACRATDAAGNTQPLEPVWDATGFGNNAVQRVRVAVQ